MSKEDKERILATNRLLEILRAERSSEESDTSDNSAIDTNFLTEDDNEELQYVSQSDAGQINEPTEKPVAGLSALFTDVDEKTIDKPTIEEETDDISTNYEEIRVAEQQLFTDDVEDDLEPVEQEEFVAQEDEVEPQEFVEQEKLYQLEEQVVEEEPISEMEPDVTKLAASLTTDEETFEDPQSNYSEEIKDDLLLKTEIPTDSEVASSNEIILPPEFNDSLITYFDEDEVKPNWKNRLIYLKRYFLDNRRKITLYVDGNTIYYLQTLAKLTETKIEKAKSFSLPYEYGNHVITGVNDMLSHIMENEIDESDKRSSFGAYFSMNTPSKTISIKSPKLKSSELKELVEWNANKNLPFSTENKNVNYKILKSGSDAETQDVIIGVTETDSVNTIDNIFKRNEIKLRYTSTLPILLWKSFVKNYPDRDIGSYVIIHIGEARTLVIVVTDHVLQFSRKIALGAQDFYKAIQKKVEKDESGRSLDLITIKDVLKSYGYSQELTGITSGSNIDMSRITIAIRPVVERIVSELSRTLNYFKNQKSDLEWKQLLFDGIASSFPGLLESIQESIFQQAEMVNPMRTGEYYFGEDADITQPEYPNYVLNFALASDEAEEFNVASKNIRENYKYSFKSKVIAAILAMMVPLFIFSGLYSSIALKRGQKAIHSKRQELQRLSVETQDYASFMGDINIINSSNHFLKNDEKYSENQIRMLKLFSSIVPEEIKLTALNYVNATGLPDSVVTDINFRENLEISGFVNEDKSVADIYLTDFILELEKMNHFSNIILLEKSDYNFSESSELFFKLRLDLKQ